MERVETGILPGGEERSQHEGMAPYLDEQLAYPALSIHSVSSGDHERDPFLHQDPEDALGLHSLAFSLHEGSPPLHAVVCGLFSDHPLRCCRYQPASRTLLLRDPHWPATCRAVSLIVSGLPSTGPLEPCP